MTAPLRETARDNFQRRQDAMQKRIIVCAGTGCVANGALKVFDELSKILDEKQLGLTVALQQDDHSDSKGVGVAGSGCQGFCQMGPLVNVEPDGVMYVGVKADDAREIVEQTIEQGNVIERLLFSDPKTGQKCKGRKEIPFYQKQRRFSLELCGNIDPEDVEEYIYHDGYKAAEQCYQELSAEQICDIMKESGLRGRGGGGFPTGMKWNFARIEDSAKKYIVCNGDEGDPGAFMDRSIMEGNPHAVIEGMLIAAKAIGADEGFVYVRAEYPLAVERMKRAVKDAESRGILGENILGTDQIFTLHIMEGAGAFVCGEETALLSSVMGRRGMPTPKPPFPAQRGLRDKPTIINNVETLATVPRIVLMGADAFKAMGTESSPGTKTFALTGHVVNTGLIEVPFGATLREIIFEIGGGVTDSEGKIDNSQFKAVQIGGPSGGCLTEEHLDLPLDFDSLRSIGAMVGSGGLVVMNKGTCMVQMAKFFMQFTQNESCGKCVPCREGTRQMLMMLEDIVEGNATAKTLEELVRLGNVVQKASLCGLGKTAPNPVISMLQYFGDEYKAHVIDKTCPAGQCSALVPPEILADKCIGCGVCKRKCPVDAISGEKKQLHHIDPNLCVRCGVCAAACKFDAIRGV